MAEQELTEAEWRLLRVLAQMEDVIAHDGDVMQSLHRKAYVTHANGGWRITDAGRRRGQRPFAE